MWHVGSLVASRETLGFRHVGSSSDQGLNPFPLHWELSVLATGPPGVLSMASSQSSLLLPGLSPVHSEGPPIPVTPIP